jgi:hypothetical protein
LAIAAFIIFFVHLWAAGALKFKDLMISTMINQWIESLLLQKNVSFLGILIFLCAGYYMVIAAIHGNIKIGLRFFTF